jgi:UDP-N-acetylmuramoyl-tripeptide--D-alanyl-D-alanine ligase
MAPERGYALRRAGADLADAGLWDGAGVALGDGWTFAADPALLPASDFLGATIDSRVARPGQLFVGLAGERTDGRRHVPDALRAGVATALTRRWDGESPDPLFAGPAPAGAVVLLSRDPAAALTVLARRWRAVCPARLAAVTGTNGKTTTKDLLAALAGAVARVHATPGNLNNDLGLPLTLLGLRRDHDVAVVEMGASRAGDIDRLAALASPQVGVITNASGAHLEGFGSLAEIVNTKGALLDHLPPGGVAVLNADSPGFDAWRERSPCPVISWGRAAGDHRWSWRADSVGGGGVVTLDGRELALPLPGEHNGANLVAAWLAARALTGREPEAANALAGFVASPHRSRVIAAGGLWLLDDCYNANPASMLGAAAALAGLPGGGRRLAVLGAMAELGTGAAELHRDTGRRLRAAGLDALWAVGGAAAALADGFREAGGDAVLCADAAAAAAALASAVRPGDRVLFKGSRSAAVERALDAFLAHLGGPAADRETR